MANEHLRAEIIGFDSGWGCADHGCEDGPHALAADRVLRLLRDQGVQAKWRGPLGLKSLARHEDITTKAQALPVVTSCLRRLCMHVRQAVENNTVPVVIGGDHSSAIGTWSGVVEATESHGNFGLIWVDAHMDSHTPETSVEGKWGGWWHGQPLSALLGHGQPELRHIGSARPKLSPRHVSLIGCHSFERGEKAFLEKHGIRVYMLGEVRARGFKAVFDEALTRATDGTEGFGLSVDIDAFHPKYAPGVGSLEDDGLAPEDVLPIVRSLASRAGFRALEIAEFNPRKDENDKTRILIENLIESVFTKD